MAEFAVESLFEIVALVGAALGSAVATLVGILAEYAGTQTLGAGHSVSGVWELWLGIVALYIGIYLLGYREFVPRLHRRYAERDIKQTSQ